MHRPVSRCLSQSARRLEKLLPSEQVDGCMLIIFGECGWLWSRSAIPRGGNALVPSVRRILGTTFSLSSHYRLWKGSCQPAGLAAWEPEVRIETSIVPSPLVPMEPTLERRWRAAAREDDALSLRRRVRPGEQRHYRPYYEAMHARLDHSCNV